MLWPNFEVNFHCKITSCKSRCMRIAHCKSFTSKISGSFDDSIWAFRNSSCKIIEMLLIICNKCIFTPNDSHNLSILKWSWTVRMVKLWVNSVGLSGNCTFYCQFYLTQGWYFDFRIKSICVWNLWNQAPKFEMCVRVCFVLKSKHLQAPQCIKTMQNKYIIGFATWTELVLLIHESACIFDEMKSKFLRMQICMPFLCCIWFGS